MSSHHGQVRRCTVYHGAGEPLQETCELSAVDGGHAGLRSIMSNNLVCARNDLDIHAAIKLMLRYRIGCLPIVDRARRPIGVITKFDLVEQLEAALRPLDAPPADLRARTVEDVMMPLALSVRERATIAQAASMMALEDTHHVLVVSDDARLVGVVSTRDIVMWVVAEGLTADRVAS